MKEVLWIGASRKDVRSWPDTVRQRVGYELYRVQQSERSTDSRHLRGAGKGVVEIRIHEAVEYRVAYIEGPERIFVLHVWRKKSARTSQHVLAVIRQRLKLIDDV